MFTVPMRWLAVGFLCHLLGSLSAAGELAQLVALDAARLEFPESVAAGPDEGFFVSLPLASEVRRYSAGGDALWTAAVPAASGLAPTIGGEVFVAAPAVFFGQDPTLAPSHGVWRVSATGESAVHATLPPTTVPNDLAFGPDGRLYVTDTVGGAVYVIDRGVASLWLDHPLLAGGDPAGVLPQPVNGARPPIPFGPGGIAARGDTLYVANIDLGTIVGIDILGSGAPGEPRVIFADDRIIGSDGVRFDAFGRLVVGVPFTDSVLRIDSDFTMIETLVSPAEGLLNAAGVAVQPSGDILVSTFQFPAFNLRGTVEGLDPAVWRLRTVPEPSSGVIAGGAAMLATRRSRRAAQAAQTTRCG